MSNQSTVEEIIIPDKAAPSNSTQNIDDVNLNPSNKMPLTPEQEKKYLSQKEELSVIRNYSTIPRADPSRGSAVSESTCPAKDSSLACPVSHSNDDLKNKSSDTPAIAEGKSSDSKIVDTENVWVYPSEQMFYNALKRKNYNVQEAEMKSIVPIHNAVNEMCWKKILEWESMHKQSCLTPKLLKFEGKKNDLTLRARFKVFLGYKPPFDRHDWTVDRCGQQVRYIIDFYGGSSNGINTLSPSFYLDVRPSLTVSGIGDRIKRFFLPNSADKISDKGVTAGTPPKRS
ncbi:putative cytochrome c1 heme lyase [Smittium culicis]|uniref:Holocytochrome c-type synthase n=1 Tax=Smittium culicis TaxID=133412 RepID=A0A1R1WY04_9FUNG|nr:putative cytochrome c1 heme lyase [Smittium culicis]OMJ21659.1 putative cytochrome c1 heme lyase [Smittium culicis]